MRERARKYLIIQAAKQALTRTPPLSLSLYLLKEGEDNVTHRLSIGEDKTFSYTLEKEDSEIIYTGAHNTHTHSSPHLLISSSQDHSLSRSFPHRTMTARRREKEEERKREREEGREEGIVNGK